MRTIFKKSTALLLCTFLMCALAVAAAAWSGSGTSADPYCIDSAADLATLATEVNNGNAYEGCYFVVTQNIDLSEYANWSPIGNGTRSGASYTGNVFKGIFDGDDKTITGLTIGTFSNKNAAAGLFGVIDGATIRKVKLENVNISTGTSECTGALVGLMVNHSTVSDVTVSGTVSAAQAGGIIGRIPYSGTVSGCTNSANVTTTGDGTGGIVSKAYYSATDETITIENCSNSGIINSTGGYVGGIAGLSAANVSGCSNTGDVTGVGTGIGGIVGEQQACGSITNCKNTGGINHTGTGFGAGGIVGWVRYNNSVVDYARYNVIVISGNENTASVTGGTSSGGIVGQVNNAAIVKNNKNSALSISSDNFAAGIVGSLTRDVGRYHEDDTPSGGIPGTSIVDGNTSTTKLENITATYKDAFAYNNCEGKYFPVVTVAVVGNTQYATLESAVAAAESGDTITLLQNISVVETINIEKELTINLADKTISGAIDGGIFYLDAAVKLTLRGGTIINTPESGSAYAVSGRGGKESAIALENCTIGLESVGQAAVVYISSNSSAARPTMTLNGCTASVTSTTNSAYGVYGNTSRDISLTNNTMVITGAKMAYGAYFTGTGASFVATGNDVTVSGGEGKDVAPFYPKTAVTLTDGKYTVLSGKVSTTRIIAAGGYYNFEIPVSKCAAGYFCVPATEMPGYYTITKVTAEDALVIATKDGEEPQYFLTIAAAASACNDAGWTLSVEKDTVDTASVGATSSFAQAAIVIRANVTATCSVFYANHLTIESGAKLVSKSVFKVAGGVNNGVLQLGALTNEFRNFVNNGEIYAAHTSTCKLLIYEGVVNNGTIHAAAISNGSANQYQFTVSEDITGENPYAAGTYYWDDVYNVWYINGPVRVISGDTATYYASFKDAYAAAQDGDTIQLLERNGTCLFNYDENDKPTNRVDKDITIDLNGYELSLFSSTVSLNAVLSVSGDAVLTIIDSSEAKTGFVDGNRTSVLSVSNGGTLILDGVTIDATLPLASWGGSDTPDTVIVRNSTLTGNSYAISHNGSYYGMDLTIENSTITAKGVTDLSGTLGGVGIYLSGQSAFPQNTLRVINSTIIGHTAIETKYSDTVIVDSVITAVNSKPVFHNANSGPCTLGFAVVSTDSGTPNSTGSISISGESNITGAVALENTPDLVLYSSSGAVLEGDAAAALMAQIAAVESDLTVSGGTFTSDVSNYCAEGLIALPDGNGGFLVQNAPFSGFSTNMLIIPLGEVAGQHQLALLAGIDTLNYQEVGFDVSLDGVSLGSFKSTVVYHKVTDGAGKVWTPKDEDLKGENCNYLFAQTMGISTKYVEKDFGENAAVKVTPYAVTMDGETVTVHSYDIPITYFFN